MQLILKLVRYNNLKYFIHFYKWNFRNNHRSLSLFPSFVPIYNRSLDFSDRLAVVDHYGQYNYNEIFNHSNALSKELIQFFSDQNNNNIQKRISFLCQNDVTFVIAQWACWMSGHVAVPLSRTDPPSQLQYYIENSQSSVIVTTEEFLETLNSVSNTLSLPIVLMTHPRKTGKQIPLCSNLKHKDPNYLKKEYKRIINQNAMILYTSGTTGPPKGVVLTHKNLYYTMNTLIDAWEWKKSDVILHTLPLHHTHGIVNALMCPLNVGACCVMLPKFNPTDIWDYFLNSNRNPKINIFMAVPTIYVKLIQEFDKQFPKFKYTHSKEYIKALCKKDIRLMVSGSSALPKPVLERWEEITGHILLERYGMTEIGMALSNPLHGNRKPNFVGTPLKGVKVRIAKKNIVSQDGYDIIVESDYRKTNILKQENEIGELHVSSESVFKEYWNKPEETKKSFTSDGWFKTGDTATYEDGAFRILGRTSVDIIKSGGFKISALDVECQLLTHQNIKECAVVGLPDITWGEKVIAIIVTNNEEISLNDLRVWCKDKLPPHLIPSEIHCVSEIQRNSLGKINKKDLIKQIFPNIVK